MNSLKTYEQWSLTPESPALNNSWLVFFRMIYVHNWKLTWNLKITQLYNKENHLKQTSMKLDASYKFWRVYSIPYPTQGKSLVEMDFLAMTSRPS